MPTHNSLVDRLDRLLSLEKRRFFGGDCFFLNGNMCIGIHGENLIIRIGVDQATAIIGQPGIRPMDLTGKVMKGWATVEPSAIATDDELNHFCQMAIDFVSTLPIK